MFDCIRNSRRSWRKGTEDVSFRDVLRTNVCRRVVCPFKDLHTIVDESTLCVLFEKDTPEIAFADL